MSAAARLLAALDHSRLDAGATHEDIRRLCADAAAGGQWPAAVCVNPDHAATARAALDAAGAADVAVAAVANFPDGGTDVAAALRDIRKALAAGAAEIDLVFPWRAWLAGDREAGARLLAGCRAATTGRRLKVILETGEIRDPAMIRELCNLALAAGADFIKTSTGKVGTGATPEAARTILECLHGLGRGGFKAAGGIHTVADAAIYLELADDILGEGWATPATFRIGASSLLGALRGLS